ncbi:LPS export ABC transporter periplasmic protein LptC [Methylocystis sp. IM3]|jgi:lipopolysaccharide export system protein LptC|uniref:LPS export ABC transporter periplasmic protein LptC n=1 Tax=unclassified Methylocystis TaxID=2625913 RepID=UPI000FAA35CB|nr:MAG: LPS export ABC transporter periplasmic protein LptC [Hyphomicrobiales bacterium]
MTDGSAADASPASPPAAPAPPGKEKRIQKPAAGRDRLAGLTARRESAFPEALRHTARVAQLRRWIVWGVGGTVGLVGLGLLVSSLRFLPVDLNLARVALQGTRIVIESPKLVGYRKDGRPYEVRARVGVQDIAKPDQIDLDGLDVRVETTGDSAVVLTAPKAVYSTKTDHADMSGGVQITDAKSFELRTETAAMDFKASVMTSDKPVTLKIQGGEVRSAHVEFSQKERRATFTGNVRSVLYGEDGAPPGAMGAAK